MISPDHGREDHGPWTMVISRFSGQMNRRIIGAINANAVTVAE